MREQTAHIPDRCYVADGYVPESKEFPVFTVADRNHQPAAVTVCAEGRDRYPTLNAMRELAKLKVRSFPVAPAHAVLPLDADPDKPASLVCNFDLKAGKVRKGTVLGPDDQPLEGAYAAGVVPGSSPKAGALPHRAPQPTFRS